MPILTGSPFVTPPAAARQRKLTSSTTPPNESTRQSLAGAFESWQVTTAVHTRAVLSWRNGVIADWHAREYPLRAAFTPWAHYWGEGSRLRQAEGQVSSQLATKRYRRVFSQLVRLAASQALKQRAAHEAAHRAALALAQRHGKQCRQVIGQLARAATQQATQRRAAQRAALAIAQLHRKRCRWAVRELARAATLQTTQRRTMACAALALARLHRKRCGQAFSQLVRATSLRSAHQYAMRRIAVCSTSRLTRSRCKWAICQLMLHLSLQMAQQHRKCSALHCAVLSYSRLMLRRRKRAFRSLYLEGAMQRAAQHLSLCRCGRGFTQLLLATAAQRRVMRFAAVRWAAHSLALSWMVWQQRLGLSHTAAVRTAERRAMRTRTAHSALFTAWHEWRFAVDPSARPFNPTHPTPRQPNHASPNQPYHASPNQPNHATLRHFSAKWFARRGACSLRLWSVNAEAVRRAGRRSTARRLAAAWVAWCAWRQGYVRAMALSARCVGAWVRWRAVWSLRRWAELTRAAVRMDCRRVGRAISRDHVSDHGRCRPRDLSRGWATWLLRAEGRMRARTVSARGVCIWRSSRASRALQQWYRHSWGDWCLARLAHEHHTVRLRSTVRSQRVRVGHGAARGLASDCASQQLLSDVSRRLFRESLSP